jgi:hypothetical protein
MSTSSLDHEKRLKGLVVASTFQNGRHPAMMEGWEQVAAFRGRISRVADTVGHRVTDIKSQLALYGTVMGYYDALIERLDGRLPSVVIGHSMNEMSAMEQGGMDKKGRMPLIVEARQEVITADEAQERPEPEGMFAFMVSPQSMSKVRETLESVRGKLQVYEANFNHSGQLVISAVVSHLTQFMGLTGGIDIKVIPLEPEVLKRGYHSELMRHLVPPFMERMADLFGEKHPLSAPDEGIDIQSPMYGGRIISGDQGFEVIGRQFVTPVGYVPRWETIDAGADTEAVVTLDPGGKLGAIIERNLLAQRREVSKVPGDDRPGRVALIQLTHDPSSLVTAVDRLREKFNLDLLTPQLA